MLMGKVGGTEFRAEHGKRLTDQRQEMERLWTSRDWPGFLKKDDDLRAVQDNVLKEIKDRAEKDFLENLLVTLIAALVTEGAALGLRAAALSETVALARTAEAISSFQTLFEVGVFTAAQTAGSLAFGQDVSGTYVVKNFVTDLAFTGALKGIGKFAEPFAPAAPSANCSSGMWSGSAEWRASRPL